MKTVLLIDDDRDDAELMQEALKQIDPTLSFQAMEESHQVLSELIQNKSVSPDLILLDLNIPVVNGWDCLEKIKSAAHLKDVPVYIFTTSSRLEEKEKAYRDGASGFITKPSDFRTLVNVMTETIQNI